MNQRLSTKQAMYERVTDGHNCGIELKPGSVRMVEPGAVFYAVTTEWDEHESWCNSQSLWKTGQSAGNHGDIYKYR